jgi:hypothetical protein
MVLARAMTPWRIMAISTARKNGRLVIIVRGLDEALKRERPERHSLGSGTDVVGLRSSIAASAATLQVRIINVIRKAVEEADLVLRQSPI